MVDFLVWLIIYQCQNIISGLCFNQIKTFLDSQSPPWRSWVYPSRSRRTEPSRERVQCSQPPWRSPRMRSQSSESLLWKETDLLSHLRTFDQHFYQKGSYIILLRISTQILSQWIWEEVYAARWISMSVLKGNLIGWTFFTFSA